MERKRLFARWCISIAVLVLAIESPAKIITRVVPQNVGPVQCLAFLYTPGVGVNKTRHSGIYIEWVIGRLTAIYQDPYWKVRMQPPNSLWYLKFGSHNVNRSKIAMWAPKGFIDDYMMPALMAATKGADSRFCSYEIIDLCYSLSWHQDMSKWLMVLMKEEPLLSDRIVAAYSFAAQVYGRPWPVDDMLKVILPMIRNNESYGIVLSGITAIQEMHHYGKHKELLIRELLQARLRHAKADDMRLADNRIKGYSNTTIAGMISDLKRGVWPKKRKIDRARYRVSPAFYPGPHHRQPAWLKLKPAKGLLPGENPVIIVPPK